MKNSIKSTVTNVANQVQNLLNLPQPEGEINAYLTLDGKEYELQSFMTQFNQPSDYKGQPQSDIKGGLISFSLYQLPDSQLNLWMLKANMQKSGEIQFRLKSSNMPLRIVFTDAKCIGYKKILGRKKSGFYVRLVISPKEITINNLMHSNQWV